MHEGSYKHSSSHDPLPAFPPISNPLSSKHENQLPKNLIRSLTLLHILLARGLIFRRKETIGVFPKPLCEFRHFVTKFAHGLVVHVRLGDEFGEGYWLRAVLVKRFGFGEGWDGMGWGCTYRKDEPGALHHRRRRRFFLPTPPSLPPIVCGLRRTVGARSGIVVYAQHISQNTLYNQRRLPPKDPLRRIQDDVCVSPLQNM